MPAHHKQIVLELIIGSGGGATQILEFLQPGFSETSLK
jgi:hypothetical protein